MRILLKKISYKLIFIFFFLLSVNILLAEEDSATILGCTNPMALNYNIDATKDDGSCAFTNYQLERLNNKADIFGCLDSTALNFNPIATKNDDSCEYAQDSILGCMNKDACNYDSNATINNNLCEYLDSCGICGGNGYFDQCGICDENSDNDCVQDCAGAWGGVSKLDSCGTCGGEGYFDECGICDDNLNNDCIQDCKGTWGGLVERDECGICDPNFKNLSCTGCIDPKSLSFNQDCYYYDNDNIIIYECLFSDGSCLYEGEKCCTDIDALNYDKQCENSDKDVCIYGFNFTEDFKISDFQILSSPFIKFSNINLINLFYFTNKSSNVAWNHIKENNRYRLIGNNEYLYSNNFYFNPTNLIKTNPIYRELKIGYKKQNIFAIDKYKLSLEFIKDKTLSLPIAMSFNDYFQLMLHHKKTFLFREFVLERFKYVEKITASSGAIVLYSNDFFSIELKGSIQISGSLNYIKQDQVASSDNQDDINLTINQTQQFSLAAFIGDKLEITADQNSQSTFDWENTLKITYRGYENELIQSLEIGNINLSLAHGTLASVSMGSSGLFGAKLVTKLGPFNISSIIGREKAIKNSATYTGGQASEGFTISEYNFIRDKYFFIDTGFKSKFYPLSENNSGIPIYASNKVVKEFILFKKKTVTTTVSGYQPGAAYYNLELEDIVDLNETANREYGEWYQLTENVDYTVHKQLGYIRLLTPTTSDMIACHYTTGDENEAIEYDSGTFVEFDVCPSNNCSATSSEDDYEENNNIPGFQGRDICLPNEDQSAGSCTSDDSNLIEGVQYINNDDVAGYQGDEYIRLKLLKNSSPTTSNSQAWDLMFKNVYYIGSTKIDLSTLNVEIIYSAGQTGTETVSLEGNSFLNIFGLDSRNESGQIIDGGDGKIDLNSWLISAEFGELILPFHMPFSYDSEPYSSEEALRYWGNPHPDLENIFEKDLSSLEEDESDEYDNYTDGPSMYYDSENDNNTNTEHKFDIMITLIACP